MAVKSEAIGDTDIVNLSITGLFKILHYALSNEEKFGVPFQVHPDGDANIGGKASSRKGSGITCGTIIINANEKSLVNTIMDELSIITNIAADEKHLPIITHILCEYISLCHAILEFEPHRSSEEFAKITDWFSKQLSYAYTKFPTHLKEQIITPIIKFREYLAVKSPQSIRTFLIYMKDIIDESADFDK